MTLSQMGAVVAREKIARGELMRWVVGRIMLPLRECACTECRGCRSEPNKGVSVCVLCRMKGVRGHGKAKYVFAARGNARKRADEAKMKLEEVRTESMRRVRARLQAWTGCGAGGAFVRLLPGCRQPLAMSPCRDQNTRVLCSLSYGSGMSERTSSMLLSLDIPATAAYVGVPVNLQMYSACRSARLVSRSSTAKDVATAIWRGASSSALASMIRSAV